MKKLNICIICFIALTVILGIYACQKEITEQKTKQEKLKDPATALNKELAMIYYRELKKTEGNIVPTKTASTSAGSKPNKKYPMFNLAYQSVTDKTTFVEIPLLYNRRSATVIAKDGKQNTAISKEVFNGSFDRLIIYKNKKTGRVDNRIVTFIPDVDYLRRHNHDVSHNHVNKLDPDFCGYLEYKKWDGTKLYLLKIENGKLAKRIPLFGRELKKSKSKTSSMFCYTECLEYWQTGCYLDDPESTVYTCETYLVSTTCYDVCLNDGLTGDPCIDYGDCDTEGEEQPGYEDPCYDLGINCPNEPAPEPNPCQSGNDCPNEYEAHFQQLNNLFKYDPGFKDYYDALNGSEKSLAVQHPFAAYNVFQNAERATVGTSQFFTDGFHNGPADAFRHAFWNGLNAESIGAYLAKGFGDAHENFQGNDQLEKQMDLFNNQVGRDAAIYLKSIGQFSEEGLANYLVEQVANGKMLIIEDGKLVPSHGN